MLELAVFVLCSVVGILLFHSWQTEERAKLNTRKYLDREQHLINQSFDEEVGVWHDDRWRVSTLFKRFWISTNRVDPKADIEPSTFKAFIDRFETLDDVTAAIREAGIDSVELFFAVDFTASNDWQGFRTFNRQCLHAQSVKTQNPYQRVISILGATLEPLSTSREIRAYGFGDDKTRNKSVFAFRDDESPCRGVKEVLACYNRFSGKLAYAGPTSFGAIIAKVIARCLTTPPQYRVLIIVSDGQVRDAETMEAVVKASNYPISIIVVGVGDGPWSAMENFDDHLLSRRRKFDNFQFVNYHRTVECGKTRSNAEVVLALNTLMEVPDQFSAIKQLKLL